MPPPGCPHCSCDYTVRGPATYLKGEGLTGRTAVAGFQGGKANLEAASVPS